MSKSKRAFEADHPTGVAAEQCVVCGREATDDIKGRYIGDDEWICRRCENGAARAAVV